MILFHRCPEYFEALCCYPIHPCAFPWQQNCYPYLQPQQQPVQPVALNPSYYAPSPKAKG